MTRIARYPQNEPPLIRLVWWVALTTDIEGRLAVHGGAQTGPSVKRDTPGGGLASAMYMLSTYVVRDRRCPE